MSKMASPHLITILKTIVPISFCGSYNIYFDDSTKNYLWIVPRYMESLVNLVSINNNNFKVGFVKLLINSVAEMTLRMKKIVANLQITPQKLYKSKTNCLLYCTQRTRKVIVLFSSFC